MKDAQIQRMNFLKHSAKGFTYKGMIYGFAAWLLFLGIIFGIQTTRGILLQKRVDAAKENLARLNDQKEEIIARMKSMNQQRVGTAAKDNIVSIITTRPRWSKILKGIVRSLHPDVWLEEVNVDVGQDKWYTIKIKGMTKNQRALTSFILQMEASGLFMHTALGGTKKEGSAGTFNFELTTEPVTKKLFEDD